MAAGDAHAEARVGAEVDAVAQDIANADHAPVPAATCAQPFFVQPPRDEADAEAFVQVEAEDVARHHGFFRHQLEPPSNADLIAVGRPAEHFTPDGFAAHGRADPLAEVRAGGVFGPGLDKLVQRIARAIDEGDLGAEPLELEVPAHRFVVIGADAIEGARDHEDEPAFGPAEVVDELAEPVALAVGLGSFDEGDGDVVALLLAELEEGAVLGSERLALGA